MAVNVLTETGHTQITVCETACKESAREVKMQDTGTAGCHDNLLAVTKCRV